jgi:A/G-specific adenine glycosylase
MAEVLLRRTTATAVNRVYGSFLKEFPSLEHLKRSSLARISSALHTLGLQKQRAVFLKRLAKHLVDKEGGAIPRDFRKMLGVPGVGVYTANAMMSFAFDLPAAVVDSNVERILSRVFRIHVSNPPKQKMFQQIADMLLPVSDHRDFNFGILDLGAAVCRPVAPNCDRCPLEVCCDYSAKLNHP